MLDLILLTVDCWRADYLGATGKIGVVTPHLDRLAAEATLFEQAITPGGWTRLAMTALFSSTYASQFGGVAKPFAADRPMLSELLRAAGYETAGFTANPVCGRKGGFERGFDTFADLIPPAPPTWQSQALHRRGGKYFARALTHAWFHRLLRLVGIDWQPLDPTVGAASLSGALRDWLERPRTGPAFTWGHYMDLAMALCPLAPPPQRRRDGADVARLPDHAAGTAAARQMAACGGARCPLAAALC